MHSGIPRLARVAAHPPKRQGFLSHGLPDFGAVSSPVRPAGPPTTPGKVLVVPTVLGVQRYGDNELVLSTPQEEKIALVQYLIFFLSLGMATGYPRLPLNSSARHLLLLLLFLLLAQMQPDAAFAGGRQRSNKLGQTTERSWSPANAPSAPFLLVHCPFSPIRPSL